eukprot:108184-Amphidinium_carterae.1
MVCGARGGAGSSHNFLQWPKTLQEMCPDTFEVCQVNYPGRGACTSKRTKRSAGRAETILIWRCRARMKDSCVEDAAAIATAVSATLGIVLPTGTREHSTGHPWDGLVSHDTASVLLQEMWACASTLLR